MANGASQAIDLAAQVGEIGFSEFTSDLVTNIFNALIDANVRQTKEYINLVRSVSATLTEYISATSDEIGPAEVEAFLESVGVDLNGSVLAADRDRLNDAIALRVPNGVDAGDNRVVATSPSAALKQKIRQAVARRIAANRYDFLQQMVQLGILRVVVDHGVVETRLSFRVSGSSRSGERTSSRARDTINAGFAGVLVEGAGGLVGSVALGIGLAGAAVGNVSNIKVQSASEFDRDVTGSRVQLYGKVKLNFKTDYQPLNPGP